MLGILRAGAVGLRGKSDGLGDKANIAVILATLLAWAPVVALADNITFTGVHYLMPDGKKPKQLKARLVLSDTSVQVQAIRGTELFKELERTDIKAATYSKSKHPRWKSGVGFAVAIGIFALPIFFMKAKHHWLTLQGENDFAALRLSKKNYNIVIAAVESRTDVEVERITE